MPHEKLSSKPSRQEYDRHYADFTKTTYKAFGELMVRAWTDPAYATQLRANPADEMRKAGIPLPADYEIDPAQFVLVDAPVGVSVESLKVLPGQDMPKISCAGSASSLSCPSCTASCAGSGGC